MKKLYLFLILLLTLPQTFYSQFEGNIHVYNVNTDEYPLIKANFYATDNNGDQIRDISIDDLTIEENFKSRKIVSVDCPDDKINHISTILTIDRSSSMDSDSRMEKVKNAARKWINQMDSVGEETAIIGFNDAPLLYKDFWHVPYVLEEALDQIEPEGGTDFFNAFTEPGNGALSVAKRANYLPVIVFLTDGHGITRDFNELEIIQKAKNLGAVIYAISISVALPSEIKNIVNATGGQYFDAVEDEEKTIVKVYDLVRKLAKSLNPCELSWYTEGCLLNRKSIIRLDKDYNLVDTINYTPPGSKFPEFNYPNGKFAAFNCEKSGEKNIKITALNQDIDITRINKLNAVASCDDYSVEFVDSTMPFTLKAGDTAIIKVNYLASNNKYKTCEFEIESNTCLNNTFYVTNDCEGTPASNNSIDVVFPDGGEVLKAASNSRMNWLGSNPEKNIKLEFSSNAGASWQLVRESIFPEYIYKNWKVPNINSENCLIKVSQMSDNAWRLVYKFNADSSNVEKISWTKQGGAYAAICSDSTIKIYNAITGEKNNEIPFNATDIQWMPDGIRLLISTSDSITIWNTLASESDESLPGSGKIDLSNDGRYLSAFTGRNIKIININEKSIRIDVDLGKETTNIKDAKFSNDGNNLAVVTDTDNSLDTVYVFRNNNSIPTQKWPNKIIDRFYYESGSQINETSYFNVEWSNDDNYILMNSEFLIIKKLEIINSQSGEIQFSLSNQGNNDGHKSDITDIAAFDDKNNHIITSDISNNVKVWKLVEVNGAPKLELQHEFVTEQKVNNDLEWSPDGTRFAVGSSGSESANLLAVYSITSYPKLQAISDSTFTILREVFTLNPVDVGKQLVGSTKDTIIENIYNYDFPYAFKVDSIKIIGQDANSFSVSNDPNLENHVSVNSQPKFNFNFTPVRKGIHTAEMTVYSELGNVSTNILGDGIQPLLKTYQINFGEVLVSRDSIISKVTIENNGTADIQIHKIEIAVPSKDEFFLLDENDSEINNLTDVLLESESNYEVNVKFSPTVTSVINSRIKYIYTNEKGSLDSTYSNLYGIGIDPILTANNSENFESVICDENDTISVPLKNTGYGTLKIYPQTNISGNDFELITDISDTLEIANGDSISLDITFNPKSDGNKSETLFILTNQLNGPNPFEIELTGRKLVNEFTYNIEDVRLLGVEENTQYTETFELVNTGKTDLIWDIPYESADGKIEVISVTPNPTLPGDTSQITYRFNGGEKGEDFSFSFAPMPYCSDSIEISAVVKNTEATIFANEIDPIKLVCKDSIRIPFEINNIGEEELVITDIYFQGQGSQNLSVSERNLIIDSSDSDIIYIDIVFETSGNYSINLIIVSNDSKSNDGQTVRTIEIDKFVSGFDIIEDQVDFIFIGVNPPGEQTFEIRNMGTYPLDWGNMIGSVIDQFRIIDVEPPVTQEDESSVVTIEYIGPNDSSSVYDLVLTDTCENTDSVSLNVEAANRGNVLLNLPVERRDIGEVFNFEIEIADAVRLEQAGVEGIKGTLVFNQSMMKPIDNNNTVNSESGQRYVPFEFENIEKGTIVSIPMKVLWGNDSCSNVDIEDFEIIGNTTEIVKNYNAGELCITDLCYEGGARLYDNTKPSNITAIVPNPPSDEIEIQFNVIEKGETQLRILDVSGRVVKVISKKEFNQGSHSINSSLEGISTGTYILEMKTPTMIHHKELIIIK